MREPFSGLSHLYTAMAAAGGSIALLIVGWGDSLREVALLVYGCSLVLMFSASAAYHLPHASSKTIAILRKLDHFAIYILIAGTYTPFCITLFTGFWKWGFLAVIWSLAGIGIGLKAFTIHAPRWVSAGTYILMGWLCVFAVAEMFSAIPKGALAWLLAGGIIYTLGGIIYMTKFMDFIPGVFGFHEVWHLFVILGAAAHFTAIFVYIALPTRVH